MSRATGVLLVFILSLGTFLTPDLGGGTPRLMIANLIAREFTEARDAARRAELTVAIGDEMWISQAPADTLVLTE